MRRLFDCIEVLWKLDKDRMELWEAEVISVTEANSGFVLAVGKLVYFKRDSNDARESEVEFHCGFLI